MTTNNYANDRSCPFVGPRPFEYGEPLFGRDREVPKLLDLLIAERIVLLFSPSGAGKTSLIQAGLIPALRDEGFVDLPIIRVKQPPLAQADARGASPANRFVRSTLESLERPRPGVTENLHERASGHRELAPAIRQWACGLPPPAAGRKPNVVLIFDQFEEILTTDPADVNAKETFFGKLGDVLDDPGLWAVFIVREEYVAALEPYRNRIPRRLATRFRLDLLDISSASAAFEQPFEARYVTVAPEATNRLLNELRSVLVQRTDGTSEAVLGPHIEPVHLQIVGLRLWNRHGCDPEFSRLDLSHLSGDEGTVDAALAGYFADKVREIGATADASERTIREWCEGQLITDQGLRGQVLREPGTTRGLPELLIRSLIDAFLVRAEERRGSTWYELAHDRLIEPVRNNNRQWRQQYLHASLLRANEWERAHRPDALLLRGPELKDVESWAKANDRLLADAEREFVRRSRAQESSKRRTKTYVAAWSLTVLGLVAILSVIALLLRRAVSDREAAVAAKRMAERDRTEAVNQRKLADHAATELMIDRGIELCQEGRTDDGLLWLMHGLVQVHTIEPGEVDRSEPPELDRQHRALEKLARFELATWEKQLASVRSFQKYGGPVYAVTYSEDGRIALTGSLDGKARIWDVGSGQPHGKPLEHAGAVVAVAISRDRGTALTGSADGTARCWSIDTCLQEGPSLQHQKSEVRAVAFSPDGKLVLTGSRDNMVRLWEIGKNQPRWQDARHTGSVEGVTFSADGRTALSGSLDGTARMWDVATGLPKGPPLEHGSEVRVVAFAPDDRTALTGSFDMTAQLWDVPTCQRKGGLLKHVGSVYAVAFSPDSRTALTGSQDGMARLWDVSTGRYVGQPFRHEGPVFKVAFSPDGRTALTACQTGTVREWEVPSEQPMGPVLEHGSEVLAVAFSPEGQLLLTGGQDKKAKLWYVDTGQRKGPDLNHDGPVDAVAFSPDGRIALTGSRDMTARLWDVDTGLGKGVLKHDQPIFAVAFSPDGKLALTGGRDNLARFWDVATRHRRGPDLNHQGWVRAVAFSRDGKTALTGSTDETARLWSVATGQPSGDALDHDGSVSAVAFHPNCETFLTGSHDRIARLWNFRTRQPHGLPLNHSAPVTGAAFNPDGTIVVTSSSDGTAQIWHVETQRPIGPPFIPGGPVLAVAFHPRGVSIATGSRSRAQLWPIPEPFGYPREVLQAWVKMVTTKELHELAVRSLNPDSWQKARDDFRSYIRQPGSSRSRGSSKPDKP
jgi:WD40 repeat protein